MNKSTEVAAQSAPTLSIEPVSSTVQTNFKTQRKHVTLTYEAGNEEKRLTAAQVGELLAAIPLDLAQAGLIVRSVQLHLGQPYNPKDARLQSAASKYMGIIEVEIKPLAQQIAQDAAFADFIREYLRK